MKKSFLITLFLVLIALAFAKSGEAFNKYRDKGEGKASEKFEVNLQNVSVITYKENPAADEPQTIKAYSKYDFVSGEKIIGFEDFMTGSIGDFPEGWNTNASAEIVTIEGKPGRWLMLTKGGVFVPEFTDKLPDNFTFEFDLLASNAFGGSNMYTFSTCIAELQNPSQPQYWQTANNRYTFTAHPANGSEGQGSSSSETRKEGVGEAANSTNTNQFTAKGNNPVHISVWRQKERVRVYFNEEKVWDVPKALVKEATYNALIFNVREVDEADQYYIGNLRLAVGAPDTRNKFITDGKWVTHGILFDVNSANVKPESYGSLKEIANVLKENADIKVKIVGHTDSDGNDAANLELSKQRAASVKITLATDFGIDESRMETDGKGETEPIDKNDTPAGKANNRRVEFVKL